MEKDELNNPEFKDMTMKEKKKALAHKKRQEKLAVEDRISHLERFEKEDKMNKINVVFNALEDFVGPLKDREPTDKKWIWPLAILVGIFILHGFTGNFLPFFERFN
jgi:hypothetical protein